MISPPFNLRLDQELLIPNPRLSHSKSRIQHPAFVAGFPATSRRIIDVSSRSLVCWSAHGHLVEWLLSLRSRWWLRSLWRCRRWLWFVRPLRCFSRWLSVGDVCPWHTADRLRATAVWRLSSCGCRTSAGRPRNILIRFCTDAENSPAAGLRNGLRSAAGPVSTLHATHPLTRASACTSGTNAPDEAPPTSSSLLRCRAI